MKVKTKFIFLVLTSCTIVACNSREKEVKEYPKKIVGRWVQNKQMLIINAYDEDNKKDTTIGQEADYKPAEIEYGSEGTYLLLIRDLNDNIKLRRPGKWSFSFDTLIYTDLNSDNETDRHIVHEITDTSMRISITTDFDADGKEDDSYTGFYSRIIR